MHRHVHSLGSASLVMLFSGAGGNLLDAQFRDGGERSAVLRATSAASTPKPPRVDRPPSLAGSKLGSFVFIENRGQFDANVKFQAKSNGRVVWFTNAGLVFDVLRPVAASGPPTDSHPPMAQGLGERFERLVFSEDFANGNLSPKIEASAAQPGIYNYFIGSDPKNWRTGVVGYSELIYCDVWPGIDVRFVVKGADIEQEFLVHPGADASSIRISYRGAKGLQVAKDGSLVAQTLFGPLRESAPLVYQDDHGRRALIHGSYKISGDLAYAFQLGSYSKVQPLVIDPTLLFSTYVGGPGSDLGNAIAVDAAGNTYVAGQTALGSGYPTSPGVLQPSCPNSSNCSSYSGVVTKLDALGRLGYSTYLGSPAGGDNARGIAVDANGEAYVAGLAQSGFPTTSNGFQSGCSGSPFVAKLNSTGTTLLYSTCLGADGAESTIYYGVGGANGIAVDASRRAYITGDTEHAFPTTAGAMQPTLAGTINAFVSIIDPSLSGSASLVYSTLLGGEIEDWGRAIAVDVYGNAYVTGNTLSSHFPVTSHAFQSTDPQGACVLGTLPFTLGQCSSAFVTKVNPNFVGPSGLIYSSYLGGKISGEPPASVGDYGYAIAVDSSGNGYIGGATSSLNFPTTAGAFLAADSQASCGAGFVTKINAGGSALVYSTFLGPSGSSGPCTTGVSGIALDSSNDAYIVGSTRSTSFPVTANAFQTAHHSGGASGYDTFLTELSASGSNLIYSSYLGGSGDDFAAGVAVDLVGDAYVTGNTDSIDFPITPFAFQPLFSGNGSTTCNTSDYEPCPDVFITKFPIGAPGGLSITGIAPSVGGNAGTVSPQIVGTGFHAGVTAQLNCSRAIAGTNVTVGAGGQLLNTTFSLTAASPGTCDVMVTNPDGTSATLSGAFTVQHGGAPNIQLYLTGVEERMVPAEVTLGPADALVLVTVSNTGNIDSASNLVWLPVNPPFSLTSVSPPAIAGVAALEADAEVLWLASPFGAGASQVFTSTAAALLASISPLRAQAGANYNTQDYTQCLFDSANALKTGGACLLLGDALVLACENAYTSCLNGSENSEDCDAAIEICLKDITSCASAPAEAAIDAMCRKKACNSSSPGTASANVANANGSPCTVSSPLPIVIPADPNSLVGPNGVGGQRWTAGTQALTYAISFSNEPTAPVPAQQVVITQPLGANANLSDLTLPLVTIPNGTSNVQVTVPTGAFNPAAGVNEFTTSVDLRPTQSLLVTMDATLNPATQTLTWTFTSIDPTTGMPPFNPLVGFLPPGAGANVAFSVPPTPGIATGTQVSEQASVVFDGQTPMSTATWTNTIDNTPPVSHVSALGTTSACSAFRVSWSGSDVGSGLQGFTIFVSDTGSPFTAWLPNTTASSADYIGAVGHTYSFYSIATDLVGNVEGAKTMAAASTSVTAAGPCGAPSLSGQLSNVVPSGTTVTATLTLTNTGFTAAEAININQITFRTLSGSGTVTLASPALSAAEGPLDIGASTAVPLTLNVPTTVARFSMTESGNLQDGLGNNYNYSIAQTVIP